MVVRYFDIYPEGTKLLWIGDRFSWVDFRVESGKLRVIRAIPGWTEGDLQDWDGSLFDREKDWKIVYPKEDNFSKLYLTLKKE